MHNKKRDIIKTNTSKIFFPEDNPDIELTEEEKKIEFRYTAHNLIDVERSRQMDEEGYSFDGDDKHDMGELGTLASLYAMSDHLFNYIMDMPSTKGNAKYGSRNFHPFKWVKRTPKQDRLNQLAKAGALIIAEMERIMRANEKDAKSIESIVGDQKCGCGHERKEHGFDDQPPFTESGSCRKCKCQTFKQV